MAGFIMAAQLIGALSILVTLHELGHFWAARAFGIKVEKFYLFFDAWNFKLFSKKFGDTEYGIGWLPLGGYVKIAGMIDESMDTEALKQPAQSWEFRSKPAWQRLIVMIGGVTMNVILGVVIFTCLLFFLKKEFATVDEVNKQGIVAYPAGQKIGFENGDKIISVNGKSIERFDDLYSATVIMGAEVEIERNGSSKTIEVPSTFYRDIDKSLRAQYIAPDSIKCFIKKVTEESNAFKAGLMAGDKFVAIKYSRINNAWDLVSVLHAFKGTTVPITIERKGSPQVINVEITPEGKIGIMPQEKCDYKQDFVKQPYTLASAFSYGVKDAFEAITSNIKGLGKIFKGEEKVKDSLQGPIGIATIFGGDFDWLRFWTLTGLLSMVLAFMNILPIPALDGGHVVFLLWEAITHRKLSDKFMERAQIVGMVILLSLMAFAFGNDILKVISKN
ncbi:MAG: RIP metalloprotease RseP [Bacteroidetes bacterium]|nr:RIP metalloprotease RseP [Bacteroidota bacterium]